jgi:hypothetical protein
MSPAVRRLALTAHVVTSVGWLGAVAAFLALAVAGLVAPDQETIRGAYLAAAVVTWWVIVPLCLASLLTGVLQSLGTSWGLLRHYWVVFKLVLTVAATLLLLLHTQPIDHLARLSGDGAAFTPDLDPVRIQLLADSGAALLVLLVASALAVYKPRGVTRYGRRSSRTAVVADHV